MDLLVGHCAEAIPRLMTFLNRWAIGIISLLIMQIDFFLLPVLSIYATQQNECVLEDVEEECLSLCRERHAGIVMGLCEGH
jgi:hypothetical protein